MEERKKVIEVVKRYQEVIHNQDKNMFDNLWSNKQPCTLISVTQQFYGKDKIYDDFLIGRIQKSYSSIDLINDGIEVNMIHDDLAIAVFQYHTECIKRDTHESYGIQGLETQVIIKEDNEWKLLHVHYSK